ncbi:hypothetical protein AB0M95_01925 [Sphaerisporangium sp. NPDC051017]|uniref:hypothetical protein n=1 Tax=Sphaerisporangium sp. NPDC051017 TaxID=3154636 RepID=UPI00342F19EC
MEKVPPPSLPSGCGVPWCRNGHDDHPEQGHLLDLGTFDAGPVTVALSLVQMETAGVLAAPVVRVFVDSEDHRELDDMADLSPHAAGVLSDALADLPLSQVGEFLAALAQGQIVLGEREEPADFYDQRFAVAPRRSALDIEADCSTRHDEDGE